MVQNKTKPSLFLLYMESHPVKRKEKKSELKQETDSHSLTRDFIPNHNLTGELLTVASIAIYQHPTAA